MGDPILRALTTLLFLLPAWRGGNEERQVDQLKKFVISVMWIDAITFEQVAQTLRNLAPYSLQSAQQLMTAYATLKTRYANQPKKRIFMQFGMQPLFTSGKGSIQQ